MKKIRKKILKIVKGITFLAVAAVLAGLTGMVVLHIYRKLGTAPQTAIGGGWSQEEGIPANPISPQEFAVCCAALEGYLEENATAETGWRQLGGDRAAGIVGQILAYGPEELPEEDALLYRELAYAERLRKWEEGLPDYHSYLSDTDGILNEIWMYLATGQGDGKTRESLAAQVQKAVKALEWQQGAGYAYPLEQLDAAIEECGRLLEELRGSGRDRLRDAVEGLLARLEKMEGTEEIVGLCQLPLGGEYYSYLLERETGSGMDGEEMYAALTQLRATLQQRLDTLAAWDSPWEADTAARELLELLAENTLGQFGGIPPRPYELRELPDQLKGRYYIGFYQRDPAGDLDIIYIDYEHAGQNACEKYEMLAHEGYPGHMYCDTFRDTLPYPRLRRCLATKAYSEGWAVYSEILAAQWLSEDRQEYLAFVTQKLLDEAILCQMDIGIHALGWGTEELETYCREIYGQIDPAGVAAVARKLSSHPAMYQSYVLGYMQVCRLEQGYMAEGHSREEFVEWFMRSGQGMTLVTNS